MPLDAPASTGIAPSELRAVRERLERDDLTVLAYRFEGDRFCAAARFAAFRDALGERFDARVLPDPGPREATPPFFATHVPAPHSVFTVDLVDQAGHPTMAARDEVLRFFRSRLAPAAESARVG